MQVSVSLPVKTYFSTLLTGNQTQQVSANSTCGLTQIMQGAPIMVLNPSVSGALYYTGGASLTIVGGPPRSIVVNSSSATAVLCGSSGVIDTQRRRPESYRLRCRHLRRPNYRARYVHRLLRNQRQHRIAGRLQRRHHRPLGVACQPGRRSLRWRAGRGRHEECHPA